jgi:hypothetical protein
MHEDRDDPSMLAPDDRRRAVARILAAGLLRLRARAALPSAPEVPITRIPPENAANPLELSDEAPLTEHRS